MMAQTRTEKLPDGRVMAYDTLGPEDGEPLFLFHSLFGCRLMPPIAGPAAERAGIRLISPDRPGLGRSDFLPGRTVLGWAKDVTDLADLLGIDRFRVFGVSAGSPYVMASCLGSPDRVIRAAIVSGLTPIDEAGVVHRIVPRAIDPLLKKSLRMSRIAHAFIIKGMTKAPDRAMASLNKTLPRVDQDCVSKPEVAKFIIDGAIEAARPGLLGWAYDDKILNEPWGFSPRDLPAGIPIDLWWGDEDTSIPLEHGRQLAAQLPNATMNVVAGAGHFGIGLEGIDAVFAKILLPVTD